MVTLLLSTSCATSPRRLSGENDIPMLIPGEKYASWTIDQAEFDQSRYYVISKYHPNGKSIAIYASDEGEAVASATAKKVSIPEIGEVRYRSCSTGGDEELARYQTDPFTRDDGHGGKVYYFVRVNTDDGDQETMLEAVKWAAAGTKDF
ncbi:MAG: hypothetical protein RLZZ505_2541 [Verrucomicrobiota bacterium]